MTSRDSAIDDVLRKLRYRKILKRYPIVAEKFPSIFHLTY